MLKFKDKVIMEEEMDEDECGKEMLDIDAKFEGRLEDIPF